jgi:hypothetical protein
MMFPANSDALVFLLRRLLFPAVSSMWYEIFLIYALAKCIVEVRIDWDFDEVFVAS